MFLVFASCFCAIDASSEVEAKITYLRLINDYLNGFLGNQWVDPVKVLKQASQWLHAVGADVTLDARVLKYHVAFMHGLKLMESPTCGPDELNILNALRELRDLRIKRNQRLLTEHIIDVVFSERDKKCYFELELKATKFMDELDPSTKNALLSIAGRTQSERDDPEYIVEGAYRSISAQVGDPLTALVKPSMPKALSSKQYDSVYARYVYKPCEEFQEATKDLRDQMGFFKKKPLGQREGHACDFAAITRACGKVTSSDYTINPRNLANVVTKRISVNLHDAVKLLIESKTGAKISSSLFRH